MDKKNDASTQNGLDPDLAELLDIEEAEPVADGASTGPDGEPAVGGPDFHTLFQEEKPAAAKADDTVDTTKNRFPTIIAIQ